MDEKRERMRAASRKYYASHKAKVAEKSRKYRAAHRKKYSECSIRYYNKNKEKVHARQRRFRKEQREKVNAWNRCWREANKKRENERVAAWSKANPAKCAIRADRRRARKAGNGGSHTVAEWIVLCWASAWRCYYCGHGPLQEKTAVQEHKTPLSRGGSNSIENIVVSCRPCNGRKHTMTEAEFMARRQTA